MPYLPIDFDGREECERAAAVLGVHPGVLSWALQDVWLYTWRRKQAGEASPDVLPELLLLGCLGQAAANPKTQDVLVAFGFLERAGDAYRVRGAAKWLFGMDGRSRGGHAAKGNLIPGGKKGRKRKSSRELDKAFIGSGLGSAETPAETPAETQPVGSTSALTANSQQHVPFPSETGAGGPETAKPRPIPIRQPSRLRALTEALVADYGRVRREKYLHGGPADTEGLKRLLPVATDEEIRARWRKALELGAAWPGCSTLAELGSPKKWNALAARAGAGPPRDIRKGMVMAQDVDKSSFEKVGVVHDF